MSSNEPILSDKKEKEIEQLHDYIFENFSRLLGKDWPLGDIKSLMDANVDHRELKSLLDNGCSKELALRILL